MPDKPPPQPVVFVVDDDAALRESLADLFASVDLRVATFASAADFLRALPPTPPAAWCSMSACRA